VTSAHTLCSKIKKFSRKKNQIFIVLLTVIKAFLGEVPEQEVT